MYSSRLWEHFESPRHCGRPPLHSVSARQANPVCGDVLELFLHFDAQGQASLSFEARACPPVIAGASLLCDWAQGRNFDELKALEAEEIATWMSPLPPQKRHAVTLLWLCLRELCQRHHEAEPNRTLE